MAADGNAGVSDKALSDTGIYTKDTGGGSCGTGGGNYASNPLDPFPGKFMERSGQPCGPCVEDGSFRGLETALNLRRYGSVYINVQRTVAGDLLIAAMSNTTRLVAFDAGVSENGNDTGLLPTNSNLARCETDGYTDGALAPDSKFDFRVTGLGVQIAEPFRAATVNSDPNARTYEVFWSAGGYLERILRAVLRASHLSFRHGKADFAFEMGRPDFYPSMSSVEGDGGVNVGRPLAGAYIPLRVPDFAGGPLDDDALTVEWWVDRTVQVEADPLVPVPVLGVGEAFLIPVTFELYGSTVRNNTIVNKADVEKVAQQAVAKAMSVMADELNPNDPNSVIMVQRMMRRMAQG